MSISEEVINQFVLESNNFKIYQQLQTPIVLDTINYNNYLKILQVQFSNVVPNVLEDQKVKISGNPEQTICGKGIYDVDELVEKYNALSGVGKLEYISSVGKFQFKNDTGSTISVESSNFLTGPIGGFNLSDLQNIANDGTVMAARTIVISSFNFYELTSGVITGNTYTGKLLIGTTGQLTTPTNTIWTYSSAMKPFQFKTWTAIMPIEFLVEAQTFMYIDFEMKANGEPIPEKNILGQSDFCILCQLVRQKKI